MRLSGVGMSPSVKTFICWQLRRWVSWEGYRGTLGAHRTGGDGGLPAGPGSVWELPGSGGFVTVPVASFSVVPQRKMTFFPHGVSLL